MVAQYPGGMRKRLIPLDGPANSVPSPGMSIADIAPPPWRIEIPAADGTPLLVLREENGRLAADYDPLKLTEAARALLLEMLRMTGGAGINWKDEAQKA
jgi:hypothetical protein